MQAETADVERLLTDPWLTVARGYLAVGRGDGGAARAAADALAGLLPSLPVDSEYLPTLTQAARIVAGIGGHPLAPVLYDALLPHRHRFVVEGIAAYTHGSVEGILGLLAEVAGRPADEHLAAARAAHERVGAALLLRPGRTGSVPGEVAPTTGRGVFRAEGDTWYVALGGETARVIASKGMQDLATLVVRPREEVSALRLAGRDDGAASGGMPVLDARARTAYRERLRELDAEIAAAGDAADPGRAEKAETERDFLLAELTHAVGLGGRARRMGDDVERARTAVTARIRAAIARIAEANGELGDHFRRSVRTGRYCSYDPVGDITWDP